MNVNVRALRIVLFALVGTDLGVLSCTTEDAPSAGPDAGMGTGGTTVLVKPAPGEPCNPDRCVLAPTGGTGSGEGTGGSSEQPVCAPDVPCQSTEDCTPIVVKPSNPIVSTWKDLNPANSGFVPGGWCCTIQTGAQWWLDFFGGPNAYPPRCRATAADPPAQYYLVGEVVDQVYRVTGQIQYFGGFLIWLEKCKVDMSDYLGVEFELWGNVGPTGTLTFQVFTVENAAVELGCEGRGLCTPDTPGGCNVWPSTTITVPATRGTPIRVLWTDLTGGNPHPNVDPTQVKQFQWSMTSQNAPIDVSLGKISLVPQSS